MAENQTPTPADDFGDFTVTVTRKPVGGVTEGQIPERLAAYLAEHAPKALPKDGQTSSDHELTLTAKDEATAKRLAGYARAWGARQEPRLRITKIPNRQDMGKNVARLSVVKDDDVPIENRPGRKAGNS